jgi:hypothetical protein
MYAVVSTWSNHMSVCIYLSYRPSSWSPHTLPVKDLCLLGMATTSGRVATVSLDRSVVLYDSAADKQYLRMNLPQPLETIACRWSY